MAQRKATKKRTRKATAKKTTKPSTKTKTDGKGTAKRKTPGRLSDEQHSRVAELLDYLQKDRLPQYFDVVALDRRAAAFRDYGKEPSPDEKTASPLAESFWTALWHLAFGPTTSTLSSSRSSAAGPRTSRSERLPRGFANA